mgnify:CR=1 FL=1
MISRVAKGGALKMLCYYASWVRIPHHAFFFFAAQMLSGIEITGPV